MNIDSMTVGEAKKVADMFHSRSGTKNHSFVVGVKYLIRTVTMMYTGRLADVTESDILLDNAAWIADSGRYSTALETGELNEVEPYPNEVWVSRAAIVDFTPWNHNLPREKK